MNERWNEMDDVDLMGLETEMRSELEDLREAATVYADRAWARGAGAAPVRPARRAGWVAWVAASVAAAALTVGGARLAHRPTVPGTSAANAVQVQSASPVSDEALLEQIHSDLSSGIPAAMEPLQASSDTRQAHDVVQR